MTASEAERERLREEYRQARKYLKQGKIKDFQAGLERLRDYPLYPYLLYDYYSPRLWKVKEKEIEAFLHEYSDLPGIGRLRVNLLRHLAKKGDWAGFLRQYTKQKDEVLQCQHLLARIKVGQSAYLLEDTRTMWLHGKSLPKQCDPAFDRLYKSGWVDNELAWQRVRLAMENGETGLASYLRKWLDEEHQKLLRLWLAVHKNPYSGLVREDLRDSMAHREIMMHGMRRLLRQNGDRAVKRWKALRETFSFTPGEQLEIERQLAIWTAKRKRKDAVEWMDLVPAAEVDDEILHWRIGTALREGDWQLMLRWTSALPKDEDLAPRSQYWHARALEQLGQDGQAAELYAKLAQGRDYYSFLAADRQGLGYEMNFHPLPYKSVDMYRILRKPAVQRMLELGRLQENYRARREWNHAIGKMNYYEIRVAAHLALEAGWNDLAIYAISKAEAWDELKIRFPVRHEDLIRENAERNDLHEAWMFGLIRAESAFYEQARSPVGALGLMQVMPPDRQDGGEARRPETFPFFGFAGAECQCADRRSVHETDAGAV